MRDVDLPDVITRANRDAILDAIADEPYFADFSAHVRRPAWVDAHVTLVFPLGELAEDPIKRAALLGRARPEQVCGAKGGDGLSCNGIEPLILLRRTLFEAVMALDLCDEFRAQVRPDGWRPRIKAAWTGEDRNP